MRPVRVITTTPEQQAKMRAELEAEHRAVQERLEWAKQAQPTTRQLLSEAGFYGGVESDWNPFAT